MKHRITREPVYESLTALNHDFECVLAELAVLHELGMFNQDLADILRIVVRETRAWANVELLQILQQREQDDWTRFRRQHGRWEKKLQDPNEAKLLKVAKKRRRKQPRSGS